MLTAKLTIVFYFESIAPYKPETSDIAKSINSIPVPFDFKNLSTSVDFKTVISRERSAKSEVVIYY